MIHLEDVIRMHLDVAGDGMAMQWLQEMVPKNEQVQRALQIRPFRV